MKIVSAASVGLEPGIWGLRVLRATANQSHQVVFESEINNIEFSEALFTLNISPTQTGPKMTDLA